MKNEPPKVESSDFAKELLLDSNIAAAAQSDKDNGLVDLSNDTSRIKGIGMAHCATPQYDISAPSRVSCAMNSGTSKRESGTVCELSWGLLLSVSAIRTDHFRPIWCGLLRMFATL